MRFLYATSFGKSSAAANRFQVLVMAENFAKILGDDFCFGCIGKEINLSDRVQKIVLKDRKSFFLSYDYLRFIKENKIDVVYTRETKLLFFMVIWNKFFFRQKILFNYEVHTINKGIWNFFFEKSLSYFVDNYFFVTRHLANAYKDKFLKNDCCHPRNPPVGGGDPEKGLDSHGYARSRIADDNFHGNDRWGSKRVGIYVSPDGVDLEIFGKEMKKGEAREKLCLPKDRFIVGYFGRYRTMGDGKGIKEILEILPKISKDILFVSAGGKRKDVEFYAEEAEKVGVKSLALFSDHSTEDLKKIYSEKFYPEIQTIIGDHTTQEKIALYEHSCDILLMPFPNTEHYRLYMSPLKMFEYMASNRPIIASDLPSVREVLNEKNAILVKPENPEELAKAIQKLIGNPALGEKLARQARADVENFMWEKRTAKILETIHLKV